MATSLAGHCNQQRLARLLVALMLGLLSMVFGLAAVTADPVVIALAAAVLVAVPLLLRPTWMITLIFIAGLMIAGVVPIWAEGVGRKAVWGISAIGLALLLLALFRALTDRHVTRRTPGFVWVALAFMIFAVVNSLIQFDSAYETLSGFKRYFQAFGLLFALAWLPVEDKDVRRWRWLLLVVALIQLPWAVYERIVLQPIREGLRSFDPFMVPYDVVAGTFGASMREGGGSSEMALFLIIVFAFLLARWREKLITMSRVLLAAPLLLAPLFLGETKIVVILLPLTFVILFRRDILSRPHIAAAALIAGTVTTLGAGYAYISLNKLPVDQQIEQTIEYNFGNKSHGRLALNRTRVLSFWTQHQNLANPISPIFGNGLGAAHDTAGGHISQRYLGYGIGLTAASMLLWEQGIFGTILFFLMIYLAWRAAGRVVRATRVPSIRADAAAIEAVLPLFGLYIFYRATLLDLLTFQIIFAAILGYLAWIIRHAALQPARMA